MNTYGEKLNCSKPPFSDKRVRQAMNYALDKHKQVVLQNELRRRGARAAAAGQCRATKTPGAESP